MMSGELPYPPMNDTMNMTLLELGNGRAVFQSIPLLQHYNPMGTAHGGWFATLLDSTLGCAVQTTLPAGRPCTTAELSITIVRSSSLRPAKAGRRQATLNGRSAFANAIA